MPNLYNPVDLHETTKAPAIALQLSHLYHKRCMIVVENSKFKASLSRKLAALIAWAWTEILLLWISDAINYKDIFQFMSGPEKTVVIVTLISIFKTMGYFRKTRAALVTKNMVSPLTTDFRCFYT